MFTKLFFLTLVLMTYANPSFALGKLGHQIVCQLAFEHLPLTKQTQISTLLKIIPKKHQRLINNYNYKKQDSPITFANACTWADAIKRLESFKAYSSWHYMNVPRNHLKIKTNDCSKNCLPQAILIHQKTLTKIKKDATWQQVQALLFLGHWLGDIHQPLHISFADDLGGNNVKFSHLATKCENLHWYWDECILYKGRKSKEKWLALLTKKWHQHSQQNWQKEQVWQWADESFQLVKRASLNYCQVNNNSCQALTGKIRLPENYLSQHQVIMEQRLLFAAQRLSKILIASL